MNYLPKSNISPVEDAAREQYLRVVAKYWPRRGDRYIHFKGDEYEVVCCGILDGDSSPTGQKEPCVVYFSLRFPGSPARARLLSKWEEMMTVDPGTPQERQAPRFEKKR